MNRNELLAKAKAQREANDWAGSAATLENWVAHQPADTAAAYYYAMALLEAGKPGDAQPYFEGMIAAGKHLAEAHYMLARCHMEQGNIA
ncbi:MAG: tetratricopeptide repeat protein, partial [Pseudomonadota bacterium]